MPRTKVGKGWWWKKRSSLWIIYPHIKPKGGCEKFSTQSTSQKSIFSCLVIEILILVSESCCQDQWNRLFQKQMMSNSKVHQPGFKAWKDCFNLVLHSNMAGHRIKSDLMYRVNPLSVLKKNSRNILLEILATKQGGLMRAVVAFLLINRFDHSFIPEVKKYFKKKVASYRQHSRPDVWGWKYLNVLSLPLNLLLLQPLKLNILKYRWFTSARIYAALDAKPKLQHHAVMKQFHTTWRCNWTYICICWCPKPKAVNEFNAFLFPFFFFKKTKTCANVKPHFTHETPKHQLLCNGLEHMWFVNNTWNSWTNWLHKMWTHCIHI